MTRSPAIRLGIAISTFPSMVLAQPASTSPQASALSQPSSASTSSTAGDSGWTQATAAAPTAAAAPAFTPAPVQEPTPAPNETPHAAPAEAPSMPSATRAAAPSSDEPPTLFGGQAVKAGGYGALGVRYARINGSDGVLAGLEGALLLDHRFAIGIAGYSWANQERVASTTRLDHPYLHYGYGGLLLRYHVYIPHVPVYFSGAAIVGAGVVGLTTTWDGNLYRENSDIFFAVEPQVGVHVNFTRWLRAGVDAGYRLQSGISKFGYSESDFNGVSLGGNIGFGWF